MFQPRPNGSQAWSYPGLVERLNWVIRERFLLEAEAAGISDLEVECPGFGGDSGGWYLQLLRDDSIAGLCVLQTFMKTRLAKTHATLTASLRSYSAGGT